MSYGWWGARGRGPGGPGAAPPRGGPAGASAHESEAMAVLNYAGLPDLATIERRAIEQALVVAGGNRRLAASLLGISERTLYRVLSSEK
jgi:transcriptional regulator with PAS, ATPase and Fis domain